LLVLLRTWSYYGRLLHGWDAQFYYAQARSLVYAGTLDVTESLQLTPWQAPFDRNADGVLEMPPRLHDRIINKYPIGLSLMEVPWLVIGRGLRAGTEWLTDAPLKAAPGFSVIEIATVAIGLLLYTVCSLVLLRQMLRMLYSGPWTDLAVVATWMGTSLFYYSAVFPFMAHATEFSLVVVSLWLALRIRAAPIIGSAGWNSLAAALTALVLVRPQQAVLAGVLTPSMWPSAHRLVRTPGILVLPLLIVTLGAFLQVGTSTYQAGGLSLSAYAGIDPWFNWTTPNFIIVLFGPYQGVIWTCPVVIIALFGLLRYRPVSWIERAVLVNGAIQIYVIASWFDPGQSDSFGPRMWTSAAPLIALGIAKLGVHVTGPLRWVWGTITGLAISWTMLLLFLFMKDELMGRTHGEIIARLLALLPR
jgi:hypothetical protein